MEEKEDKGFVVRDRRKISLEETAEERSAAGAKETEGPHKSAEETPEETAKAQFDSASEKVFDECKTPLPEVTLSTFIFSLSTSALVHLGEIAEPDTSEVRTDLPMARQIIDTLGMLQEKTRGNLDPDEDRFMKSVLYDLRMRYVQKCGGR